MIESPGGRYAVLVVGRPASGKSTVAAAVAERYGLPLIAKDVLKEILFDTLGASDRAWSVRLGRATFALLEHVVGLQLAAGTPFVVDAAYDARFENERFQQWQREHGHRFVQIHCTAPKEELLRRFAARSLDGSRHPGHADDTSLEEYRATLDEARAEVLEVEGPVVEHDTAAPDALPLLLARLDEFLAQRRG